MAITELETENLTWKAPQASLCPLQQAKQHLHGQIWVLWNILHVIEAYCLPTVDPPQHELMLDPVVGVDITRGCHPELRETVWQLQNKQVS